MSRFAVTAHVAEELVRCATVNVRRAYPHQLHQVLTGDQDVLPPRALHPAFYGSYDWHSAVHNHWLLAYALTRWPELDASDAAAQVLDAHLTPDHLQVEKAFFEGEANRDAEKPYGWAWLVKLHAELQKCEHLHAPAWAVAVQPLARMMQEGLVEYLQSLTGPVHSGVHSNTAFILTLLLDAADQQGDRRLRKQVRELAERFYDTKSLLTSDPPAYFDFLDPVLAAADLMSSLLEPDSFARWLDTACPQFLDRAAPPSRFIAVADSLRVHADGMPLSRTWALGAVHHALPAADPRRQALAAAVERHLAASHLDQPVTGDFLADHWIPSFVGYLDHRLCEHSPSPAE